MSTVLRGRICSITASGSRVWPAVAWWVPAAAVGDEVVVIGRQGDLEISPAEIATRHGLGLHHIATTVGPRVSRIYHMTTRSVP